ncbi:alpha/beta hydrolase [Streptomyces sp. BRA346]|uniref:alpha/beta hydrolase n=1 Tax=Streptomyces sp. BRA346 TaxID=2878199 RepID=UPI00406329D5
MAPRPPAEGDTHAVTSARGATLHQDSSHGVFASRGNACVDRTAAAYLVDGRLPAGDVHCTGPVLPEPGPRSQEPRT